jgi:hypothetical protein
MKSMGIACWIFLLAAVPWAPAQFRDSAATSTFSYVTRNDYRTTKYFLQPLAGGVAILDYDRDGQMDLFFTNGAELPSLKKTVPFSNCLLRNLGKGQWTDRTVEAGLSGLDLGYSLGVAAGDCDNDGFTDLFIANAGPNALYQNNGNGTFSRVAGLDKPPGTLSVGGAWFDYDKDGLLDLLVAHYTLWTPETDHRCINPSLGEIYCSPTGYVSVPNQLFHNLGNGTFEDVTEKSGFSSAKGKGMGISIADFNGDGILDALVVNDTERNFLYINQGNGTFQEQGFQYGVALNEDGITVNGMGSDANDFNNDGFIDVFHSDLRTQIFSLFLNQKGRFFNYASPASGLSRLSYRLSGRSNQFIDYDNDGWKDIYSANGDVDYFGDYAKQSDTMFRNMGGKTLSDVSETMGVPFLTKGYHRGSAIGDLNGDGALDIVVTGLSERPRILMNTVNAANHWLMLSLTGIASNRDAIGAKVQVTTASGSMFYNHVSVSTGLMSTSDKRVHFGLGSETAVKSVEITWPSGKRQRLENVAVDRILSVEEPRQ